MNDSLYADYCAWWDESRAKLNEMVAPKGSHWALGPKLSRQWFVVSIGLITVRKLKKSTLMLVMD